MVEGGVRGAFPLYPSGRWDVDDVFSDRIFSATGGLIDIKSYNGIRYVRHRFFDNGTFKVIDLRDTDGTVDVMVVGGGATGGGERGGGGGGRVRSFYGFSVSVGSYPVTVGATQIGPGGQRTSLDGNFSQWTSSSSFRADGGSRGASLAGGTGGSGGGGSSSSGARNGGVGGSNGGNGAAGTDAGGGAGEGFSTREFNQQFVGGSWQTIDVSSTDTLYAGGGGGGGGNGALGGEGGGGPSINNDGVGAGVDGTGGGGGSSSSSTIDAGLGNGGSGIVIIRYPLEAA